MPFLTVFGIKNSTISAVVELIILFLVVIWLALVYWTYADARRRISDSLLVGCATAASLFPFVGTIVYMIVRPPEFLDDVRERELEMQAAEARLAELGYHVCPYCDYEVEKDFLRCPNCMRKLKDPCSNCGKPLDPMWKICPFCESEVGGVAPPRRARRRRDGVADQPVGGTGGLSDRGAGLSDRGAGLSDRGAGLSDRGAGLSDRGAGLSDRGAGLSDRNSGRPERPAPTPAPAERRGPAAT
jgi:Double zinc ribbon